LYRSLEEIRVNGIDLYLHVPGVDTASPGGRALFQMLGVFAELSGRSFESASMPVSTAPAPRRNAGPSGAVERLAERRIIAARAAAPQKATRAIPREFGVSERHLRRLGRALVMTARL
jgi:DNA invertase Pin-like site-specific DNA recombinase